MEQDARSFATDLTLEGDVCIVGAGPAGIALAHQFLGSSIRVLLVESGGREEDAGALALARGEVSGDPYNALEATRHRSAGGTVRIWNTPWRESIGAKYVPLDAIDFEQREWLPGSGWPFDRGTLEPHYRRAHRLCRLGPFNYGEDAGHAGEAGFVVPPLDSPVLRTRLYRIGPGSVFTEDLLDDIRVSPNVTLICHACVTTLCAAPASERIEAASARVATGRAVILRAGIFVIAAGGIENARLLLPSAERPHGIGGALVGRSFMEHPRDYSLVAFPESAADYALAAWCDAHETSAGSIVRGRLAIDPAFLREERLLNASITLFPMMTTRTGRAIERARRAVRGLGGLRAGASNELPRTYPKAPDGWSKLPMGSKRLAGVRVLVNLEQAPHPENRVSLGEGRNRFGERVSAVHWRWRDADARNLARLHAMLRRELPRAGLGRVEVVSSLNPDPSAHHHAGTTRMSADERSGVVDPHGRVHAMDNLYVTGGSVFPTAGFANPTLTIVALALRLGEHLRDRLGAAREDAGASLAAIDEAKAQARP